jgi:uncharacterized protein YabN with tetrapyrrole methylase and pyrophosphatase domain
MNTLQRLIAQEKDARAFGFDWPNQMAAIKQIINECKEIIEDIEAKAPSAKIQEEMGDLLHAAVSLCVFSGFDVEDTLEKIIHKFGRRMDAVKDMTRELGLNDLHGQSTQFMLNLWDKAKVAEHN